MTSELTRPTRSAVNRAGVTLSDPDSPAEKVEKALAVLSEWRSAHAVPLNTIYVDMQQKVRRIRPDAILVQRLKRARSIVAKLRREEGMKLARMQDIGGCRAVLRSIPEVEEVRRLYKISRARHVFDRERDYIAEPATSGYRSRHLIYKFQSANKPEFNELNFEIQLRTELQHAWATAVETVGAVLVQALKASEGEERWLEFFKIASAAFAHTERCPSVPGMPTLPVVIARQLEETYELLGVREKLSAYTAALRRTSEPDTKNAAYFLLVLRPEAPTLEILSFSSRSREAAQKAYARYERELPLLPLSNQLSLFPQMEDASDAQAVLVGAESFQSLRRSYPNYYLDMEVFIQEVESFIRRYK